MASFYRPFGARAGAETRRPTGSTVHTIRDTRSGGLYGLRHDRMAVVAFRSHQDAYLVSRALEHHESLYGCFPEHDLKENPRSLESLLPAPLSFGSPRHLVTQTWHTVDDLTDLCQLYSLDLLFCRSVNPRPHLSFTGEVFSIEDPSYYRVVTALDRLL